MNNDNTAALYIVCATYTDGRYTETECATLPAALTSYDNLRPLWHSDTAPAKRAIFSVRSNDWL